MIADNGELERNHRMNVFIDQASRALDHFRILSQHLSAHLHPHRTLFQQTFFSIEDIVLYLIRYLYIHSDFSIRRGKLVGFLSIAHQSHTENKT